MTPGHTTSQNALPVTVLGSGERRALLVHGINARAQSWWCIAESLAAAGWTTIAVDLPGHGRADATADCRLDALAALLPGRGWDLVIGHSLGATLALLAQATDAGFARRLVLIEPVLELAPAEHKPVREQQLAELDADAAAIAAAAPHWHPRDVAEKAAGARAADPRTVAGIFDANRPWSFAGRVESLTVPTLVIGGDAGGSSMLPAVVAQRLAGHPGVSLRRLEGAGHAPQRDRPEPTLALIHDAASV
ncbi:MAG: alpha/beta hydrolase [Microbacteriaceae bacterium]